MAEAPLRVVEVLGNAIVGGMETAVKRLLAALPRDAFNVTVIVPFEGALAAELRDAGHDVAIVPFGARPGWIAVHHLASLAQQRRAQVLHAHMPNAHLVAALAGSLTSIPVVATLHAMHLAMGDLEAHRLCDSDLVCVSEAGAAHAAAVGVDPARLTVIRNAVPPGALAPPRPPGHPFTVAWVGRLSIEKNPELFVRAAARLAAVDRDVRFAIVGDGPLMPSMRALAASIGVADRIDWHGEVRDAASRMHGFDAVALTSWHEGTPLVLLEAIAAGVPVVATAVGGVPEIVAHEITGLLVPAGDVGALEKALRRLMPGALDRLVPPVIVAREEAFARHVSRTLDALKAAARRRRRRAPMRSPSPPPGAFAPGADAPA